MRANPAAGTLVSVQFWTMLFLSLFAAPALMAARGTVGDVADRHSAELIRDHQDALSPFSWPPETEDRRMHSREWKRLQHEPVMRKEGTSIRDVGPEDEPMIHRAGRGKRIRA